MMIEEYSNKRKVDARDNDIVFSRAIKAGKRIYYLDVKRNRKDELFLAITESKKVGGDNLNQPAQFEKHKIFLYKEDFDKFADGLEETINYIRENNTVDFVPKKEYVDGNRDINVTNELDLDENLEFVNNNMDIKVDF